jgi:hypothetical protein
MQSYFFALNAYSIPQHLFISLESLIVLINLGIRESKRKSFLQDTFIYFYRTLDDHCNKDMSSHD